MSNIHPDVVVNAVYDIVADVCAERPKSDELDYLLRSRREVSLCDQETMAGSGWSQFGNDQF
jgi:hypothetical protein